MVIAQVRVLIPDTEAVFNGQTLFTDAEIETYLQIANGNVLRAAAFAMLAVANSEAMISKVITTQDLHTDGSKVADAFRKSADTLLRRADQVDRDNDKNYFQIVDYYGTGWTDHAELTEWWNGVDGQISPNITPGKTFDGGNA